MTDGLDSYREQLYRLLQSSQESFDKAVMTLSGGGLGISFAFADRFLGTPPFHAPRLLVAAWASWGVSVALALWSHYSSACALSHALEKLDQSPELPRSNPADRVTAMLNIIAGALFPIGILSLALFVLQNMGGHK